MIYTIAFAASLVLPINQRASEQEALAAIEQLGGEVRSSDTDSDYGHFSRAFEVMSGPLKGGTGQQDHRVVEVRLLRCSDIAKSVEYASRLSKLSSLWLGSSATDTDLKTVSKIRSLNSLRIYSNNISDDSMPTLAKLDRLERLEIHGATISDRGLKELAPLVNLKAQGQRVFRSL